jgi:hypothetical protein
MGQEIESGLGIGWWSQRNISRYVPIYLGDIKIGQTELCKAATKKAGVYKNRLTYFYYKNTLCHRLCCID